MEVVCHASKDEFKQIFRDHWAEFQNRNPRYRTAYYDSVIGKMLGCGDYENGFLLYRCLGCGEEKRVAFSCKSSFCLSCAKIYTDRWVDYVSRSLFVGVRYRHVVLTVPENFRKWFYRDPGLLSILMQTGHRFYQDVVSVWLKEPVEVGCIVVLQTAGRSGTYNPHLHILCAGGGMTQEGEWKAFGFVEYGLLHRKWQYHLLNMLRDSVDSAEMREEVERCWEAYPKGFVAYIEKGDVPAGGKGLARYLAKYVVSPPISLKRILEYDGSHVRYWYKDHTTGKRMEERIDALTFIGRMVQHILPKSFQRIRYYGLHATCRASGVREQMEAMLEGDSKPVVGTYRVTGYRDRIKKDFGIDPLSCQRCGEEMKLEGIWHPKHGWIVDNWDDFFTEMLPEEKDGKSIEGTGPAFWAKSDSAVSLQMCIV